MKSTLAILAGLALGAAIDVSAQENPPPPGGRGFGPHGPGPHGPPPVIVLLDADKDGTISEAEINDAPTRLLERDADKDGQVTLQELCPPPKNTGEDRPAPGPGFGKGFGKKKGPMGPPPLMKALDANDDRILSSAEIQNAAAALLTLDANQDKQLTREELRPHGPPPGEEPPAAEPQQ